MLETVCRVFKDFPDNGKLTDGKGQTPFHIAMKGKRSKTSEKICTILGQFPINPLLTDSSGKRPDHGKSKTDRRVQILQEAGAKFLPTRKEASKETEKTEREKPRGKKRRGGKKARRRGKELEAGDGSEVKTGDELEGEAAPQALSEDPPQKTAATTSAASESLLLASLKQCLKTVLAQGDAYFTDRGEVSSSVDCRRDSSCSSEKAGHVVSTPRNVLKTARKDSTQVKSGDKSDVSVCFEMCKHGGKGNFDVSCGLNSDDFILPQFDDLPWEVECPERVVKFFKDKRNPAWLCKLAVQRIETLARGEWRDKNCRKIASKPGLQLYETRLTKSSSLVWEVVVQFSPRCTNKVNSESFGLSSGTHRVIHVYSEVIRLWDVVLDHDQLSHCLCHIQKSHDRGREASVKIPLMSEPSMQVRSRERLPKMFLLGSDLPDKSEAMKSIAKHLQFVPAWQHQRGRIQCGNILLLLNCPR